MNNAGRGIAGILKDSDFLDPLKESIISDYKVEKASKAGKANSEKYQKLRDLALKSIWTVVVRYLITFPTGLSC